MDRSECTGINQKAIKSYRLMDVRCEMCNEKCGNSCFVGQVTLKEL